MTEQQENVPAQYVAARLRRMLAEDPRTAEQGVRVTVRGQQVMVSGDVASPERREQLEVVLREAVPDMVVHNDVRIVRAGEPTDREELT
ncbi:MAG TPA: BON domain-containing protein [Actinophytocola sp.]|uniref:BON domain-containing protein n=1 Tax=Actinophytocola sp. TaxID=1872138 RepID=UPI002DDD5EA3|nr:BON domain-containing protein [Actinophytocola sp.]HEV2778913.1 BON domain-containing protein [Actinophytocola sp.]